MLRSVLRSLIPTFDLDPAHIEHRLRARLSRTEFFGLCFAAGMLLVFIYLYVTGINKAYDLDCYYRGVRGDFREFHYAHWSLPFFWLLMQLPPVPTYLIWALINLAGVWLACRIFNMRPAIVLISYQMFYILYYGSITGVIIGALALFWWALQRERYVWAGAALIVAITKFQLGVIFALALVVLAGVSWRNLLKISIIPAVVVIVSLIVDPIWPIKFVAYLIVWPSNTWGSITLWQWIGPISALLWLPVLFVPLSPGRRLAAVAATSALALPYFQQSDLLLLFVLPIGSLFALLGNLGYLMGVMSWSALKLLALVPLIAYIVIFAQEIRQRLIQSRGTPTASEITAS